MLDLSVLESIDHLNSWVRSTSASGWYSSPRRAIYDWKSNALKNAIATGEAESHPIYLSLTCRDCGGSKRYTDSYGIKFPHCRRCSSTGITRLEFIVTEIGPFVWHTPRDKSYSFHLPEDFWSKASLSVEWEPNAKGRDMELWEVVAALNVCEMAVLRGELCKPSYHGVYDYGYWIGDSQHDRYKLNLGRLNGVCVFCGEAGKEKDPIAHPGWLDGHWCHAVRSCIDWVAYVCLSCNSTIGSTVFDRFPVPVERLEHPEIRQWLERRGIRDIADAGMKIVREAVAR